MAESHRQKPTRVLGGEPPRFMERCSCGFEVTANNAEQARVAFSSHLGMVKTEADG